MPRKRLGELLLEHRLINTIQLEQALSYQRQTGHRLGAALVGLGFMTEQQLCASLAKALGLKAAQMPPDQADPAALRALRSRFCEANDLFPLAISTDESGRKRLTVVMADPLNQPAIDEIEFTTGMQVIPMIAPLSGVRGAIAIYYLKRAPAAAQAEPAAVKKAGEAEPSKSREGEARGPSPWRGEVTERTALADLIKEHAERRKRPRAGEDGLLGFLGIGQGDPEEQLRKLEGQFWALLRIMAKKGLITRDEFLREIDDAE